MIKVGSTGGIGSGKSTVARVFRTLGVPVFEADAEGRRLLSEDERTMASVHTRFGPDVFRSGVIDRAAVLGERPARHVATVVGVPRAEQPDLVAVVEHRDPGQGEQRAEGQQMAAVDLLRVRIDGAGEARHVVVVDEAGERAQPGLPEHVHLLGDARRQRIHRAAAAEDVAELRHQREIEQRVEAGVEVRHQLGGRSGVEHLADDEQVRLCPVHGWDPPIGPVLDGDVLDGVHAHAVDRDSLDPIDALRVEVVGDLGELLGEVGQR